MPPPEPVRTSAAPLHIEEPSPYDRPEPEIELPRVRVGRSIWAPLLVLCVGAAAGFGVVKLVRYSSAEVNRAENELHDARYGPARSR